MDTFFEHREYSGQDLPLNSRHPMILCVLHAFFYLNYLFTLTWSSLSNFSKLFFTYVITLASPQKIFYGYFKSKSYTTIDSTWIWPLHECDDLKSEEIWKPHDFSLVEEPEDSNGWRWEQKNNSSRSIKKAWWSEKVHRSQPKRPSQYNL